MREEAFAVGPAVARSGPVMVASRAGSGGPQKPAMPHMVARNLGRSLPASVAPRSRRIAGARLPRLWVLGTLTSLNWRGVVVFGLAVLTVIVLIRVIDDDPASLGVNTAGSTSQDDGTRRPPPPRLLAPAFTTTQPGGSGSTTTTSPAINPAGKPTLSGGRVGRRRHRSCSNA